MSDKHLYKTARWDRRRRHQLSREPLCKYCLAAGRTEMATVVDHVVPHRGDPELFWNSELQSLCESHHNSSKQSEELRGYAAQVGMDGVPVDPRHPVNRR
jgi:5-methylcytosine-specific restriction protein A